MLVGGQWGFNGGLNRCRGAEGIEAGFTGKGFSRVLRFHRVMSGANIHAQAWRLC